ncbi:DUF3263 domain-containing protein [Gordonia otitidis]|uniref:DUF3263 domain-containing protein n=1 Tax=Gordonia otitidis TaxID=249058 RepID=UPI001D14350E|nr:DUF3263 domain-containing protein [Gordonia otitidis]UEA61357.1 DUF3263 domain-containing protein [Gordonia otitidis]
MTDEDRRLLDMAGQRWNHSGAMADAIRTEFGMSVTRFWQRVNRLCDTEEALAYAPLTVNRLRRLRVAAR